MIDSQPFNHVIVYGEVEETTTTTTTTEASNATTAAVGATVAPAVNATGEEAEDGLATTSDQYTGTIGQWEVPEVNKLHYKRIIFLSLKIINNKTNEL